MLQPNFSPGPGKYELKGTNESPSYSLAGRHFLQSKESPLGPGQYNPSIDLTVDRLPDVKITGSPKPRDSTKKPEVPGPGAYPLPSRIGESTKWSFSHNKRVTITTSTTPGPGTYDQRPLQDKRAFSLGAKIEPLKNPTSDVPGPGAYNPTLTDVTRTYGVGKSVRKSIANSNFVPGPGAYTPELVKSRAAYGCNLYADLAVANGLP